jgi:hypothetical protein
MPLSQVRLPPHAHILFKDLQAVGQLNNQHVIAKGVREDGSVILSNRTLSERLVVWLKTALMGREDHASIQINALLTRQLYKASCGVQVIAANARVGIGAVPLRNRDVAVVAATLAQLAPEDPASVFELRQTHQHQIEANSGQER